MPTSPLPAKLPEIYNALAIKYKVNGCRYKVWFWKFNSTLGDKLGSRRCDVLH